jgi:23S rRNA U2552 (ribose-2'-O)-methylase RlmE/FtsJ
MSYFKIPSNLNININENTYKINLICAGEKINQVSSQNLSEYLKEAKKKIDNVYKSWDLMKIYTNPYEFIHTNIPNNNISISQYKPISRAFYKLIEIYNMFNLLEYNHPIETFHLAEGPGGFIEATTYLRQNENDKYYGMTLQDGKRNTPGWKKSKKFLEKNSNITLETGIDNTGNLFNNENFKYCCTKYKNKFEIITADGGIDFSDDFNNQEILAGRLLITQVFYALSMQKKDGTFILKIFDIFNKLSIDIVYLLSYYYESVFIVKPNTSRYANSEKYIVCISLKNTIELPVKKKFYRILKLLNDIDFYKYNISSILNLDQNLYFLNIIQEINHILGQRQIENILYTIKLIENKDKYKDKIDKMKAVNIQRCVKWCNENNVKINKIKDIICTKNIFLN